MEQFEAQFKQVDVFPLVKYYMDELKLLNLFKKYVPPTSGSLTDHAESLCILTANIICDNKPLYKVQEWLSKYSDGLAGEKVEANLFNDDWLARALTALFHADRHSLMTEVSCNAISVHELLTDEIHNDSTTITFKGKYNCPDPEAVKLKHGHNKDYRPDCKQIVFGLNITSDGHIPLSYKLFDGNTSDDVTHIPNWNALRTLLGKEDFIYVADCKLCSQKNLKHIANNGGYFITIIPKDRVQVKLFKKKLKGKNVQWKKAFEVESTRKKGRFNIYKTYALQPDKNGFRNIFVHSSSKQQDDERKRKKRIEKALSQLEALSPKLNAYHLKTKKQIQTAVDKICEKVQGLIDVRIITERKQVQVPSVSGRRITLNRDTYKNKWVFKHKIEWVLNDQAITEASKIDGVFPLITNTDLSAGDVLKKYKSQPFLEKRMYTKKTVLEVAPVFIKKENRIEAMLFLYFTALMVVSLIERKIRMNMKKETIEKLSILPQRMNTKKPTWNNIRYFFRNIHYSEIFQNEICLQATIKGLSELHEKVLQLLEIPSWVYINLNDKWWQFRGT